MISKTLRLELDLLGMRVMTIMLSQVSTQMYANTQAFLLPEGSPCAKIAGIIASQNKGELNLNYEPADVVAKNLVI